MPQEAYLSNTSFAVNVSLDSNVDPNDVWRSIQMAELAADADQWRSELREEIGETGVNLSGGQKQRVNLARALHSGRSYLVLDDPLSAVDSETEGLLMNTLLNQHGGFFLASHRLLGLNRTDRLLVLAKGRIIEDGDPKVLQGNQTSQFHQHFSAGGTEEAL